MAKPTLFYTLRRAWHVGGFEVIRVTTNRRKWTGAPGHYYGSDLDGMPTHCRADQCVGEFPTEEAARAVIDRVKWVREQHAENLAVLGAALVQAQRDERAAIDAVVAGLEPGIVATPISLTNRAQAKGVEQCKRIARQG